MHGTLGRKLIGAAAAVLTAVCTMTAALPASQAAYKQEEYLAWSQMDERWGETPMGATTIRRSGCLVTSLAIMVMDSGSLDEAAMKKLNIEKPEDFNPGVLAAGYTDVDGFSEGGAIKSWLDIQKLVPSVKWGYDTTLKSVEDKTEVTEKNEDGEEVTKEIVDKSKVAAEVQSLIENGWYLIARVNTAYGGWHWVYIRGVKGDDIYMSDPASTNPLLYEVYPDGLQGEYWALRGKNSPEIEYIPPERFEPFVTIEVVTPPKTLYSYGEELDLSDCVVKRRGKDLTGEDWEDEPVLLTEAEDITYSTYFFDPQYAGDYELRMSTYTDYAYGSSTIKLTVSQPVGEYYLGSKGKTEVYDSELGDTPIMTIGEGCALTVTECIGRFGHIKSDTFTGWADVSKMTRLISSSQREKGDIDGDGYIDKYDLAQLNIYLKNKQPLPDGISLLTAAETEAADMNSDGTVDEADFIALLAAIQ